MVDINDPDKKSLRQGGFTLLEVIVSISILAVGLLAVASMQVSAIYGNSNAGRITSGTSIAEDKIEQLLSLQYTLTSLDPDLAAGPHVGDTISGYATTWNVIDASPVANCKTITVKVTWQDKGITRSTSLSSYMSME